MRGIALEAGVSPASIVVHFKNKTMLLEAAVCEDIDKTIDNAIECFPEDSDLLTRLTHTSEAMFTFYDLNRDLYRSLLSLTTLAPESDSPEITAQMDQYVNFYIAMIEEEKKKGTIRSDVDSYIASGGIISLYFGILLLFFKDENITPVMAMDFLRETTKHYLKGIMI